MGDLNNRSLFSHNFRDYKSKIKVPEGLISPVAAAYDF